MTRKDIAKMLIRLLITFACMLPIFVLIGYLLYEKISDIVMMIIVVVLGGAAFALEELVHYKIYQKRQALKEQARQGGNKKS